MALQGTLSDFGIDDVLRLLEHGKKRGRLRVTGAAGSGNVWVDDGSVVASASGADEAGGDHTEVVFQLMRLEQGEFNFHSDDTPSSSPNVESIADVLSASSARLTEWKQLSEVLPSVEHWLALTEEIPSAATIEPAQWKVLALIGGGTKITTCVDELGLGLVPGCRVIVELVDRSLLAVSEEQPARAVLQVGRVDPQLPSVGAHQEGDAGKDDAKTTEEAEAGADEQAAEATKDTSSAKTTGGKGDPKDAKAAEDLADDAHAEDGDADEAKADDAKADDADAAASAEGDAAEAGTDADVNPRALLRLLNSVK